MIKIIFQPASRQGGLSEQFYLGIVKDKPLRNLSTSIPFTLKTFCYAGL